MSATNYQTGQSLLEIAVSIGIAIVVVTALTITTINGLKNSQFSQNQIQATKLAQQGLENVKAIKSRNCEVRLITPGAIYKWADNANLVWNIDLTGKIFIPVLTASGCFLEEKTSSQLIDAGGIFYQQILIDNTTDPSEKKVTSQVTWQDFSGTHQSDLITIIANY